MNSGLPCGQAGAGLHSGLSSDLLCDLGGREEVLPASFWASAPFSVQWDRGARGWEPGWTMWPQRSYPDTPMGLKVHRSRMAGVSSPCNPKTLPARPPPAFRAKRASGLRKGLSPNKEVCRWPLEGAPSRSPPLLPLVTALPQLHPLAGHLGGPQGHHPLRHWGGCGLGVCCRVGGNGVWSSHPGCPWSQPLTRAHPHGRPPYHSGGCQPSKCWGHRISKNSTYSVGGIPQASPRSPLWPDPVSGRGGGRGREGGAGRCTSEA